MRATRRAPRERSRWTRRYVGLHLAEGAGLTEGMGVSWLQIVGRSEGTNEYSQKDKKSVEE